MLGGSDVGSWDMISCCAYPSGSSRHFKLSELSQALTYLYGCVLLGDVDIRVYWSEVLICCDFVRGALNIEIHYRGWERYDPFYETSVPLTARITCEEFNREKFLELMNRLLGRPAKETRELADRLAEALAQMRTEYVYQVD